MSSDDTEIDRISQSNLIPDFDADFEDPGEPKQGFKEKFF